MASIALRQVSVGESRCRCAAGVYSSHGCILLTFRRGFFATFTSKQGEATLSASLGFSEPEGNCNVPPGAEETNSYADAMRPW